MIEEERVIAVCSLKFAESYCLLNGNVLLLKSFGVLLFPSLSVFFKFIVQCFYSLKLIIGLCHFYHFTAVTDTWDSGGLLFLLLLIVFNRFARRVFNAKYIKMMVGRLT